MKRVLDASALLAYLRREPGYGEVVKALDLAYTEDDTLLISAVNWGEVSYVMERDMGAEKARLILQATASFPIDIVPADKESSESAAEFKSSGKLAYADGFAAALAQFSGGELLTADRDFESVRGQIKVRFIR